MKDSQQTKSDALSVSDAMALAKGALESVTVKIIGEVSELSDKKGYKAVYFTVKDDKAALPCLIWNNRYASCGVELALGALVELTGRFSLYAAKGRMNFDVFNISLAGEGELRLKVAALAKRLQAEGLFNPARKKPIPAYPVKIGLVTSPRGAAVHDVLRTLRRRYPLAEVLLAGVPVEGANAPENLIEGLKAVSAAGAEVILLVRGGGSFEDLMPFNDEKLALTVASLNVPVITGIGHEPDTSICDMVADVRASTPTAAAEAVSSAQDQILLELDSLASRMSNSLVNHVNSLNQRLKIVESRPIFSEPMRLFEPDALKIDSLLQRMDAQGTLLVENRKNKIALLASRLEDLSPLSVILRGYSMARNERGEIISKIGQVDEGTPIDLSVSDGIIKCSVVGTKHIEFSLGEI